MTVDFTRRITIPDSVMLRAVADEAVILNLDTESYFGLDAVGARMWQALSDADSIQAAGDLLLTEYEVEAEQLRRDLSEFIAKLLEHGLMTLQNGE